MTETKATAYSIRQVGTALYVAIFAGENIVAGRRVITAGAAYDFVRSHGLSATEDRR